MALDDPEGPGVYRAIQAESEADPLIHDLLRTAPPPRTPRVGGTA
jgi:hypothetical protein